MYERVVIFTVTLGMLILTMTVIYILLRVSNIEVRWYFNLISSIVSMLNCAIQPLRKFYNKNKEVH